MLTAQICNFFGVLYQRKNALALSNKKHRPGSVRSKAVFISCFTGSNSKYRNIFKKTNLILPVDSLWFVCSVHTCTCICAWCAVWVGGYCPLCTQDRLPLNKLAYSIQCEML